MIKFELNRIANYSDEEIIREIQRVANVLNISPLTISAFHKESKVNRTTIGKRFGGWKAALEAANLGHLYSGQPVTQNMREQKNKNITDEELLSELQRVASVVGRNDISSGDIKTHSSVHRDVFSRRFGSWEKAIQMAGLESRALGAARRVHTNEDLFENLLNVWTHYGRQPHFSEMNEPPSKLKNKNYTNRFGTWRKALLSFVDFMNGDSSEDVNSPETPQNTISPIEKSLEKTEKKQPEDRREIPLGLRFKVMYRDHFKCVLCGDNPPATPGLILHVDHITPWSKGGKTQIDNIRTLCASCNIGRGNRYSD